MPECVFSIEIFDLEKLFKMWLWAVSKSQKIGRTALSPPISRRDPIRIGDKSLQTRMVLAVRVRW